MKKAFIAVACAAILTGCATNKDYQLYAETQQKIAQANAMAETARFAALAEIAKQGDSAAKVAAVMSLNFGSNANGPRPQAINPPTSFGDKALQWTSVLLPSLTQFYGISANRQVAITQSNNQAAIAQSTNSTFATMSTNQATSNTAIANAGLTAATNIANSGLTATQNVATAGFTAIKDVANAGLTSTQNVATAGITGVVTTGANGLTAATTISGNANTAITNVSNAANASLTNLANQIPNLQPNVTTTTTTTTTNNNLTCPAGKTLVNGSCV